ncbi:hypothetical protein H310_10196 [Aphanomyces invadans]|uniref:Major facilitator superfamily (MFS) profile domain-containing protein n=1 Tax=Aphanomyces invadans TaxID=157072 RepID=A0A024TR38_9STRA|nr:hypothetical protein H310_10196 [Aphanomyces invadans]ETV96444.1 hypothetical protein H310_10196 [Aphanomyces invadans]|eukprot:XP_008874707.1 hypothetical protein H310_10196 [Aphanomyces invadans]
MATDFKPYKTPAGMTAVAVLEEPYEYYHTHDEAPNYLGKTVLGHIIQYFVIGMLLGSISSLNGPFFATYFHMDPAQANLAKAFTAIVWSCKVGFGIVTDCFPIMGYRRKSWMVIGWTLCLISMLVLCCKDHGAPYVPDARLLATKRNLTASEKAQVASPNVHAPNNGLVAAAMCGVVTVFYVMADVAADSMIVEMSLKEPDHKRGRLLAYVYGSRNLGSALVQVMIGSFLNSPMYGGDYAWGLSVNEFFAVLTAPVALMLPVVLFMLKEVHRPVVNCPQYLAEFWHMVQTRPFWQTLLYAFFFNLLSSVVFVAATPVVKYEWAEVDSLHNRWMTALSAVLNLIGLWFVSHVVNQCNWRRNIVVAMLIYVTIGATVDFFTIYNVVRSEWLTLCCGAINSIMDGVYFLSGCIINVELAQEGKEGVTYGMLTTMANVAYVFTPFIGHILMTPFTLDDEVKNEYDSPKKRYLVAVPLIIGYSCSIVACGFVLLLPKQREHIRFMKAYGGRQPVWAGLTLCICFASVVFTAVTSILSVFPTTRCLALGGGTDC